MTKIIDIISLLILIAAIIFYCRMSNAGWGFSGILTTTDTCVNQAITAGDGCDVYVITD